ncbi:MAG TPA: phage holin family protein [Croceibacterium sp.]|nr:phage holin family protein [Croceibacterium sp.]
MTPPEDERLAPPGRGGSVLPEEPEDPPSPDGEPDQRSLTEDVEALIEDGKTYLEAEIAYQKTRAAFVADRAKSAFLLYAIAAVLGFLALVGLTVGLIIALTPLLTAWGASALVVAVLLLAALLLASAAGRRWSRLMAAIDGAPEQAP